METGRVVARVVVILNKKKKGFLFMEQLPAQLPRHLLLRFVFGDGYTCGFPQLPALTIATCTRGRLSLRFSATTRLYYYVFYKGTVLP